MRGRLPRFLEFKSARDLVRLGRHHDGGYLVSRADIEASDKLIGLGLFDDWSFEKDFVAIKSVPVTLYDASVDYKFWIQRVFVEFLKNPIGFYGTRRLISYQRFFRGNRRHTKKFVGLDTEDQTHCTLKSVLEEADSQSVFLKIDIEGSEYRIFDTLIDHHEQLSGLAIELHDCDLNLSKIEEFVRAFPLKIVHIHANNHAPVRRGDDLPLALELTFSRFAETEDTPTMPHALDMPNKRGRDEIVLEFAAPSD